MEETETVLTLADFGALLRERRIHKGLTEENVAAELKITSRLVKAIEEGDMESMPHAVYARGFIRAYAKLLAVDDSVTHAACALLKDPEEELREQEIRVVPAAARREESHVPWLAIPRAQEGGDVGVVDWNSLDPTWQDRLSQLKPGDVSGLFEVNNGLKGQLKLLSMESGDGQTLEEATPQIERILREPKLQERFREYSEQLRKRAVVEIRQ